MLVIRVLWLQVALAAAQLVDLDGVLGGGDAGSSEVGEADAVETSPPGGLLDGLLGDNAAAATGGLLDPLLDPIVGPTGLLGENDAAAAPTSVEAQDPPAATSAELAPQPTPTQAVDVVVETATPEPTGSPEPIPEPTPEPTLEPAPEPAPTSEQAAPVPTADQQPPAGEQQQQQPGPVPAPAPEASTAAAALPTPATSVAAPPAAPSADADVIPLPNPAPAPAATSSAAAQAQTQSAAPAPAPTASTPPTEQQGQPADQQQQNPESSTAEPVLRVITAPGGSVMSVFVPPSPTGALAAVDGANNLASSPDDDDNDPNPNNANINTSPFTQPGSNSFSANPAPDSPDPNTPNPNTDNSNLDQDNTTGISSSEETNEEGERGIPLQTKIGLAAGLGAGTILFGVILTWVFWKRRMARGPPRLFGSKHRRNGSGDGMGGDGDLERGSTPEEKAKFDFESEHDVAVDFGGFFRERGGRNGGLARSASQGSQGSQGSSRSGGSGISGMSGRSGMGDRLPAFELAQSQSQVQPPQRQQVVAELDGGAVPEYRGVVGYAR